MNLDEKGFTIITPYSQNYHHPTNSNRMDIHQQPLQDHVLQPTPLQYAAVPKFQDNYGNEPQPSMLRNTPRYPESSRTIKEEQDLNTYLYSSPTDFRGEMNLNVHHPIHTDHNTIRYPSSHNQYPSDSNSPNTGGLAMPIGMTSRLESPEVRHVPGPAETPADFRYQIRALQSQHQHHPQRHQHGPLPHHQHPSHALTHLQGNPTFFSPSMDYSSPSLDQEHNSPGGGALDRQPQAQLSPLEYDSREPHTQRVSVPAMVYDPLAHEPMTVPGHSQQGVRHETTLNHRGSLASINSNSSGSYHTTNSPASIPMSNNKHSRGTASSMNTSVPGTHTSSSFSMGPSNSSRWIGHPSGFDMAGSTAGATSVHGQVPALSSTQASASSLRPILRHSDSDSRSSPEHSFPQDSFRLRASTSAQTLSSSRSTHSHTNSPSPRLSDNESTIGGRHFRSELFSPDDRESDQDVDANETVTQMSEKSSAGRKEVIGAGKDVGESFLSPIKKKKKSKMHRCEVCGKKFPRPSGLRTHMNTHNNEKPYPCGFPGCTRTFGVRSNAKRHLRTHGVVPTLAANLNSTDAPYVVGFCPPMILAPQSSAHQQSQLHSVEGGKDFPSGIRLHGDNANIHTQNQGQSDVQHEISHAPLLKLRWMPPSLTTRTNAGSLREVRDEQQVPGMREGVEEGDGEDDFVGGSCIGGVRRTGGGGYNMDMKQDDMEDGVGDGDKVEFGNNIPRLSIPLRPVVRSSSTSAIAASTSGIRLTISHPAECLCTPCSELSTQGRCRSFPSSSRTFTSISPVPQTSIARSNSSLSSPSMSTYGQREMEMTDVGDGGIYTRTGTLSQEYNDRETRTEERNSYLEAGSHPYHPSQLRVIPGPTTNSTPSTTVRSYLVAVDTPC